MVAAASHPQTRPRPARIRWDRVSRVALLFALVVLLYLAISPLRSLLGDLHLSAERHAELRALQRTAAALAATERRLGQASTSAAEARNLGYIRPGEREYVVRNLPNN